MPDRGFFADHTGMVPVSMELTLQWGRKMFIQLSHTRDIAAVIQALKKRSTGL